MPPMPPTILKIGGSVLTEKTDTPTPIPSAIERCAEEIASCHPSADNRLILIHGAGSFGHPQAKRHDSPDGFTNFGIIKIHRSVKSLNELVIRALIENGVPAAGVHPFSCVVAEDARIREGGMHTAPIAMMLARGIVPVLHGDVVMDGTLGASIISGDQIAPYLAVQFGASRIGFGTAVDGVIADGVTVPHITPETFESVRSHIHGSEGTDVTGGMLGKVRELLKIDIDSYIFNASKPDMVARFLSGEELGTRITRGASVRR